jgi:glycosyltransferase involved in cell wall biosynthesis
MRPPSDLLPRLTVVIATYNRAETLRRTLDFLAKQDLESGAFDVIVVSDRSPDATQQLVAEIAQSSPYELRYLETERNRGPGPTQNLGIRAARGPIILLIADDIFMTPGALRAHLDFHQSHPEREAAALGKVIQSPEVTQSVFLRNWDPFRFNELEGLQELAAWRFGACNLSFKRDFMLDHGMFLEESGRAGPGWMEDLELGYRLKRHGLRFYYAPAAWGYHYHVCTLDWAIQRWYERGMNYGQFRKYATDPELTVYFHVLNTRTFREYARVLRGPNPFRGRERSFVWHLFRHCVRMSILNRFTARWLWKPILNRAEKSPRLATLMSGQIYRAFLYYHFLRGVRDGHKKYGD